MAADETTKTTAMALAATAVAAVATLWAAAWTGASTMLAAAILALVIASSLALLRAGKTRAERPADAAHPFGYAKEIAFWSFVVAILLFALGAGVALHEGLATLVDPHPIRDPAYNVAALAGGFAMMLVAAVRAHGEFKRRRGTGPALVALRDLKDPALFSLLIQIFAALAGFALAGIGLALAYATGAQSLDGYTAIAIGLLLMAVAAFLSIEVRALIAGEAASPGVIHDVRAAIAAERGVGRPVGAINEIRTMQLGPNDILVVASVDFEDQAPAAEIEAATSRIEAAIKTRHPNVRRFFMEGQSARDHTRADREAAEVEAKPAKTAPSAAPVASLLSAPAMKEAATPAPSSGKPAAPSVALPQRESRKGRKRQKHKRR